MAVAPRALARLFGRYGDRKPFAALGAASFEHVAPTGSCHPSEKAVRAFASTVVWLVSSFHRSQTTPVLKFVLKLSPAFEFALMPNAEG
jgi:hypothetical protein